MKSNNLIFVLALLCLFTLAKPTVVLSQPLTDSTVNFFTLSAYYDHYYDSLIQRCGAENMRGTGYKDYLRWKWFYTGRHGVDGDHGAMWKSIADYYDNFQQPENYIDESDWQFMGPLGIPLGHDDAPSENTGKGMMLSLWVSEGDHSLIYAGSHHGGLWKTTDGGNNWFPLHDNDTRIHGVNSIAVDPEDHDIIYITGNTSLGEFSNYSVGLFKSTDGGNSWQVLLPCVSYPTSTKTSSVRKIIIDPNDRNILYFVSYRNVCRSNDQGASWETVFFKNYDPWDTEGRYQWHNGLWDFKITPWNNTVAYLAGSEIFRITNPQGSFDTTNISEDVFLIGLNPGDSIVNHPNRCEISITENFPQTVWFCYSCQYNRGEGRKDYIRIVSYNPGNGYKLIYDEKEIYNGIGLGNKLEFAVSPSDSSVFYVGGVNICKIDANNTPPEIYLSNTASDYPDSCWIHIDMRDMQIFSDGRGNDTLYLANDAGISWGTPFKGSSGNCPGTFWYWRHPCASIENGLNVTEFYGIGLCESEPDLVAGGCQDVSNMLYHNGKWINFGDGDGSALVWDKNNKDIFYFSELQNGWLYRTNDMGAHSSKFFDMANLSLFVPMELDPKDPSVLYSGDTILYKFTGVNNFPGTISDTINLDEFPYGLSDIEVVKASEYQNWFYVSTLKAYYYWESPPPSGQYSECIYKSTSNGSSFTDISANLTGCLNGRISDIEVNPDNKTQIWVAFSGYSKNSNQQKKVFTSSNSGSSWQDFSQGLPPGMPVFKIKFVPQYDFLLAASDVGIFKRNLQDTAWFPFSHNLPEGKIVTDLEINPKYNTIVASTYGRGIWKSPVKCNYQEDPWVIRENLTWEKDTILDRSVTITDSITVTLRNCRIHLPSEAKIVVQQGGTLILDSCTLTSACNDLWWGVEVWGDSRYPQTGNYQGKVILENGATIEKARKAIFCSKNIQSPFPDRAFNGGIVLANNAFFKNNQFGVLLWTYPFENLSHFTNCKFQTTETLADRSSPEYLMALVQVKGIRIEGCDFEYLIKGEPDFGEHGRGIISFDAKYEISPNQVNYKLTTFKNLEYGVMALRIFEDQPILIHDSYFDRNLTGIYARGIQTLNLYLNEFLVYMHSDDPHTSVFGGVYLDNCSGYTIEENTFRGLQLPIGNTTSIGLTISNSGEAYNEIYNNTFSYLDIGTLAQNINRSIKEPDAGLKLNCNVYNLNEYDISVTGSQGCTECGISQIQGSSTEPAGNWFSKTGVHPTSDFNNEMAFLQYFHHRVSLTGTNKWIPRWISNSYYIDLQPTTVNWDDDTCESHLGSIRNKELNHSLFVSASLAADSLENILHQLIDGGNTDDLEMEITFAESDEALELRDELLGDSPYLSDTILIKSVEKEDVLAPVMVKEIMVANPQSAKSEKVLEALENRENPIPDYMMSEILEGKDTVAHKEILVADLSWSDLQREIVLNRLINIYRNDTSGVRSDSIVTLLQNFNTLPATYRLVMTYFEMGDTASAQNCLNSIPQQFDLSSSQATIHQHWNEMLEVMLAMKSDSLMIQDLDTTQLATIVDLAIYEDLPGCLSRNILQYLSIAETAPYYLLPADELKAANIKPSPKKDVPSIEQPLFKIYPNPAKNHIIVEYNIIDISSDGLLTIYSQDGKLQLIKTLDQNKHHFIINTKNWSGGLYFFNFITQDHLNQTGKIIIAK